MTNVKPEIQRNYDDFTYVPDLILKSMGIDILKTPKPRWQTVLLRLVLVLGWLSHCYMLYYLVLRTYEWETLAGNPTTILRYGIVYFYVLNADIKLFIFTYHLPRLRNLNDKLRRLFPKDSDRRSYRINKFYWPRITRYGAIYYYFVFFFIVFGPSLQSIGMYIYERLVSKEEIKFLYLSTFPMERLKVMTPLGYFFSQLVDIAFSQFTVNISFGTDVWMMCLSGQLGLHFDHLGTQLENFSPSRSREKEDLKFLASIVRKHQLLFRLHEQLNDVFSMLVAYDIFSSATTLCCVAFYTILQGLTREGIGFFFFFFSTAAQFYMVCFYGQLLIDLSENISVAAYKQKWYNGSSTYRKHLLMIMQRAQRPASLSAKGVIVISMETFTRMMNLTYRFYAVLRRYIIILDRNTNK